MRGGDGKMGGDGGFDVKGPACCSLHGSLSLEHESVAISPPLPCLMDSLWLHMRMNMLESK